MKTRVIQNWQSSVLGVILLILSSTLLGLRIISLSEFAAFFPTILGLLYVRDSVFKVNPPNDCS
jgi:hypothetical protein